MNINKLYKGQIINNYILLCELLDIKVTAGSAKIAQLKELERYIKYHKKGQKYIIDEIYNEPLPKIYNYYQGKEYEGFNVTKEYERFNGVYVIKLDNDVYIGSTASKRGFKGRFIGHFNNSDGNHTLTSDMIKNGGIFSILWCAEDNNIRDEILIRMIEQEYINHYIENTNYNVANTRMNTWSYRETLKPKKLKKRNIKVSEDEYKKAIKILSENGIIILN